MWCFFIPEDSVVKKHSNSPTQILVPLFARQTFLYIHQVVNIDEERSCSNVFFLPESGSQTCVFFVLAQSDNKKNHGSDPN